MGQSHQGLLAEQLLHSFPLVPTAQAASRQAFLREIEEPSAADHRLWEKAARYVLAEWPALASLDQGLVRDMTKLRSRIRRKRTVRQRGRRQRPAPVAVRRKAKPWWLLVIPFAMLGGIMTHLEHHNSSPSGTPLPGYPAPLDVMRLPGLENPGGRDVAPPQPGTNPPQPVLLQQPLIYDLLNPSKFDIEALGQGPSRILRFTPRPGTTISSPYGPRPNTGPPLNYGEAALVLMGLSREQINTLFSRAAKAKHPEAAAPTPPKPIPFPDTRP